MTGHALVTGGQQGIGLGVAQALAQAGLGVSIAAEAPEDPGRALPAGARYFRHDLREIDAVPRLLDAAEAAFGPITALISNAGVPARVRGDMLDLRAESFDHVMSVNLRGAFFLAQGVARRMLATPSERSRAMIFVTSVSAALASVERAEYCLSKAGAAMMAQLFALRLAPHGIGVFDIRPGIIDTPMTAPVHEKYESCIAGGLVPAGRWGHPADVAAAILPLVRGEFAFATGAILPLDGGLSIPRL